MVITILVLSLNYLRLVDICDRNRFFQSRTTLPAFRNNRIWQGNLGRTGADLLPAAAIPLRAVVNSSIERPLIAGERPWCELTHEIQNQRMSKMQSAERDFVSLQIPRTERLGLPVRRVPKRSKSCLWGLLSVRGDLEEQEEVSSRN